MMGFLVLAYNRRLIEAWGSIFLGFLGGIDWKWVEIRGKSSYFLICGGLRWILGRVFVFSFWAASWWLEVDVLSLVVSFGLVVAVA